MYIQYNYTNKLYSNNYNISQYYEKKTYFNQKDNTIALTCFLLLSLTFIWFLCYKNYDKN